jgi:hypothetical protein
MPNPTNHIFDESPGLEGPDYVALVIEWDQLADRADPIRGELAAEPTERIATSHRGRTLAAAVASVLGVLALAWGIHRLRAA